MKFDLNYMFLHFNLKMSQIYKCLKRLKENLKEIIPTELLLEVARWRDFETIFSNYTSGSTCEVTTKTMSNCVFRIKGKSIFESHKDDFIFQLFVFFLTFSSKKKFYKRLMKLLRIGQNRSLRRKPNFDNLPNFGQNENV